MARKIQLSESDLTNLIEKVIKEQAARAGGFGYGFVKEDSEGEETYHYGEDEGHDRKEVMSLSDRCKEIRKHLDAIEGDEHYDRDHEDRGEKGTDFMESRIKRRVHESRKSRRPVSRKRPVRFR
tara:strand:+ start:67 stop:438 length:372 start_codon:yes stop_codon:yes gene_type:complete